MVSNALKQAACFRKVYMILGDFCEDDNQLGGETYVARMYDRFVVMIVLTYLYEIVKD